MVKLLLPPGAFSGPCKNQETVKHLYFENFPRYYDTTGDGHMDEKGYFMYVSS